MSRDINLQSTQKKRLAQEKRVSTYFRIAAIFSLIVVSLSAIVIFFLKMQSPVASLRDEETRMLNEFSQNEQKALKYIFIKSRLQDIQKIMNERSSFDRIIDVFVNVPGSGVSISNISILDTTVSLTVSATSLDLVNSFLNSLVGLVGSGKPFQKITLEALSLDIRTGRYLFSLTINTANEQE